jgi:hypothetical protein
MDSTARGASPPSSRLSAHSVSPNDTALCRPTQSQSPPHDRLHTHHMNTHYVNHVFMPRGPAIRLRITYLPGAAVRAAARPGVAFSNRSRTREGKRKAVLRRPRAVLLDCKFATLNQLFGGDKVAGLNWSGVRLRFVDMVAAIASAESREAVAGGCWFGTVSGAKYQSGTAGVGTC